MTNERLSSWFSRIQAASIVFAVPGLAYTHIESRRILDRYTIQYLKMLGPLGTEKSMLARRLTTILPAMTLAKAIETTRIHSVAGLTGDRTA
jgi:hypothetical protein